MRYYKYLDIHHGAEVDFRISYKVFNGLLCRLSPEVLHLFREKNQRDRLMQANLESGNGHQITDREKWIGSQ